MKLNKYIIKRSNNLFCHATHHKSTFIECHIHDFVKINQQLSQTNRVERVGETNKWNFVI